MSIGCGQSVLLGRLLLGGCLMVVAGASSAVTPDVRVLIDISGSMKQNDPQGLRRPALRLLVNLLPEGAYAGVWTFGRHVNMDVPHARVDERWRHKAERGAASIHSRGLFTDIEQALARATWDWREPADQLNRSVILLTDGMVDVSKDALKNAASRERLLAEQLERLVAAGVKIHSIALSDRADLELLTALSAVSDGYFEKVVSAEQLQRAFLRMFEAATRPDAVPLESNRFLVDPSIEELTILSFGGAGEDRGLLSPSGERFVKDALPPEIRWREDTGYQLITIRNPAPGAWQFEGPDDPDNRVLVVTDLRMQVEPVSNHVAVGETLQIRAHLEDQGVRLERADFLKFVSASVDYLGPKAEQAAKLELTDDGQGSDKLAADGIYSAQMPVLGSGSHVLTVNLNGGTFARSQRLNTQSYQPARLSVEYPEDAEEARVHAVVNQELFIPSTVRLSAQAEGQASPKFTRTSQPHVWQAQVPRAAQPFVLSAGIKGLTRANREFTADLPELTIEALAGAQGVDQPPASLENLQEAGEDLPPPEASNRPWWQQTLTLLIGANLLLAVIVVAILFVLRRNARRKTFSLAEVAG